MNINYIQKNNLNIFQTIFIPIKNTAKKIYDYIIYWFKHCFNNNKEKNQNSQINFINSNVNIISELKNLHTNDDFQINFTDSIDSNIDINSELKDGKNYINSIEQLFQNSKIEKNNICDYISKIDDNYTKQTICKYVETCCELLLNINQLEEIDTHIADIYDCFSECTDRIIIGLKLKILNLIANNGINQSEYNFCKIQIYLFKEKKVSELVKKYYSKTSIGEEIGIKEILMKRYFKTNINSNDNENLKYEDAYIGRANRLNRQEQNNLKIEIQEIPKNYSDLFLKCTYSNNQNIYSRILKWYLTNYENEIKDINFIKCIIDYDEKYNENNIKAFADAFTNCDFKLSKRAILYYLIKNEVIHSPYAKAENGCMDLLNHNIIQ